MAIVNPKVKKMVLLIKCKPNQEMEIPFERILRKAMYYKRKFPNAEITLKIVSHQL